ncbi:unnamed protein product [Blepharisma stoltei]|uniref:Uncharacterized protein n=1 Tax=Blepharisma stoltei TaxID=1481888 RepID=A0AAU9IR44_9CILI|nr:unnamed protein product [Blepharisma stoltei]
MAKSPSRFSYSKAFRMPLERSDIGIRKSADFSSKEKTRRPNFNSIIDDAILLKTEYNDLLITTPNKPTSPARKLLVSRAVQRVETQNSPRHKKEFSIEDPTEIEPPRKTPEMYTTTIKQPTSSYKEPFKPIEDLEKQYQDLYKEFTENEYKRSKILEDLSDELQGIKGKYQKLLSERENEKIHWEKYIAELENQLKTSGNDRESIESDIENISRRIEEAGNKQIILLQKIK